jgi:glycosyltransferase involved in cell wall biosynthesis
MKVLQVISYFNPKFGGDVNVCINISKELVKRNHTVTILTTDFHFDGQFADMVRADGIAVIPVHCIVNFGNFLYSPTINTWLRKNLRGFDIIHLHTFWSHQHVAARSFAIKYRIPYIMQAHGTVITFFDKQNLKKLYDFVWGNKILRDASKLIALTETEKEQYRVRGVPEKKICIIPNGINLSEFEHLPKKGKFRQKFQIQDDCRLILYIGRLHEAKGLDLLVDAFYELNKISKDVRLMLAGPDEGYHNDLLNKIQKLNLENEILVPGFISNEEKIQAFIDSDVFVTPFYWGFPVTFLEACACGLPIITTTHGDKLNWFNDNVGIVVEYNQESLKNAILKILNDDELKIKFGEKGKEIVKNEFNWGAIILKLETAYLQSIDEKSKLVNQSA